MLSSLLVAVAVIRGLPPSYVGLLVLTAWFPGAAVLALSVVWFRERATAPVDAEVAFLSSLTAHLGSGQSIRRAITLAAESAPSLGLERVVRSADAGLPIEVCAKALASALPTQGEAVVSALVLAARTGGRATSVFEVLTSRAASELDLERELRSGTAGARLSVLLLAGAPLVLVLLRARDTLTGDATGLVVAVGTGLTMAGVLITWAMVRKAIR
jgi:Flp pilus assembly protein TadB